jgi:D-alanyl-D-alanine endopeptidase (penicillin-binding protein 7)
MNGAMVASLGWGLIQFLWQGAVLGCVTAILMVLLRNARAQTRYAVLCVALALCIALPVFDVCLAWGEAVRPDGASPGETTFASLSLQARDGWETQIAAHMELIVIGWALCATALALRMALGLVWIGRIPRRGTGNAHLQSLVTNLSQQFGLSRHVRLLVVPDLMGPVTVGLWRPLVLVPASLLTGMAPNMLEALLAHELAHVQRCDYLVNLVQSAVEALLFYHPAVWWISYRLRIERELIADSLAATRLGEPRRLALALSELERFQFSQHHLAQAANGGVLMTRIARLIRPETQALNWKAAIPVLGMVIASLAFTASAGNATNAVVAHPDEPGFANLQDCKPDYPAVSLKNNESGTVKVKFSIGADGKLRGAKVTKPSGHPALDDATLKALSQCSFRAAVKKGKAVAASFDAIYVWKLPD